MSGHDERDEKPTILSAADLVHLNPNGRLPFLGRAAFLSRREVLRGLLGTAAFVLVPAGLTAGCEAEGDAACPENAGGCGSDTYCACEVDDPSQACEPDPEGGYRECLCACEADASTPTPTVSLVDPPDGSTGVSVSAVLTFRFSEPVNRETIGRESAYDDPATDNRWGDGAETDHSPVTELKVSPDPRWREGIEIEVGVYGRSVQTGKKAQTTARFTTEGESSCPCQSDSGCPSDCGSYCSCQPDYCGCQFEGCPTYRT